MPIEFRIDDGVSDERWSGTIDTAQILAFLDRILADPRFGPGLKRLVHLGDAAIDVSYADLAHILERLRPHAARIDRQRWAIVAGRSAQFGLARMFEALGEDLPIDFHVFREEPEARLWLAGP